MSRRLVVLLLFASACHHFDHVRFEDRAILWRWPDDRPIYSCFDQDLSAADHDNASAYQRGLKGAKGRTP